jgi:SAM-dependent methyltransferase
MRVCLACAARIESVEWQCACGWAPEMHGRWPVFAPDLAENTDGFSPDSFARLFQAEAGSFWFRSRNRLLIWALRTFFPQARNLLEIGCGTGFVLAGIREALPRLSCAGSEVLREGLEFAERRLPDAALFQMDARHIPFAAEFDVVGVFDVLEHIAEDERVIEQMFQATKPGGGIIVTVPQHQFLWSAIDEHSFHQRRYSRADLVNKLERAGFRVAGVTSFVSLLLPLMWGARLRANRKPATYDPCAELRMSRPVNAILERVMGVERLLITRGVRLPVGGSLLAIARKPETAG